MDFSSLKREGKSKKGTVHFCEDILRNRLVVYTVPAVLGAIITMGFLGVFFWGHLHILLEDLYFTFSFP